MRHTERGGANWPFIISLVLLLVFGFLWYDQKDQGDKTAEKLKAAQAEAAAAIAVTADREIRLDKISEVVGWRNDTKNADQSAHGHQWTSPEAILNHLTLEGLVDGKPGAVNAWRSESTVEIDSVIYKLRAGEKAPPVVAEVAQLSQQFKDALNAVREARPKDTPTPPDDWDDAGQVAKWTADLKDYKDAMDEYVKKFDTLMTMREWPIYKRTVEATVIFDPDKTTPWRVTFWETPSNFITLQEALAIPAGILKNMRTAFEENKRTDAQTIKQKNEEIAAKAKEIDNAEGETKGLKQQLAEEQSKRTEDVARLQKEAQTANENAEKFRVEATGSANALQTAKDEAKRDKTKLETEKGALLDAQRINKEVRELAIQRNDPDGEILDASPTLGTGAISLGFADKVFPGLKFEVSYMGRGNIRTPKGWVVVTRVVDAHYSQIRVEAQASDTEPIGRKDMIANPFFDAKKTIHVWLAGDLRKYPKQVAKKRLGEMGVVIDEELNSGTDYIIVPASVSAPPAAPAAEGEAAPAAGDKSPYEKLAALARTFGATLITERVLEAFLDY